MRRALGDCLERIEPGSMLIGVGWAIRAAPDGAIPWHRVVNARGGVSTDAEHPGLQRAMLEAEGIVFDDAGLLDLARHAWSGGTKRTGAKRGRRSE